ncbi:MAG: hypothetical protein V4764_04570 [Burkholderia sp.]
MSEPFPGAAPGPVDALDTIDAVAGLAPDGPVAALRRARGKVDLHTRGSEAALFDPALAGLSLAERWHAARHAAALSRAAGLAAAYRARLDAAEPEAGRAALARQTAAIDLAAFDTLPPRLAAIAAHVRLLVETPVAAGPAHLAALRDAGLDTAAIVALSQLVAFVTYQARVVAAAAALQAHFSKEAA